MFAIIIILFLALTGAAFTLFFRQRTRSGAREEASLQPRQFAGLFEDRGPVGDLAEARQQTRRRERAALLERARRGEVETLSEAHAMGDRELYREVLDAVVDSLSDRQTDLLRIVSYISKSNGFRGSRRLAERLIQTWENAPDRRATARLMHIAALSDDAATYERAVETVLDYWRQGKLSEFRAEELSELFISQFWLIAPEARGAGVGFALKRKLLGVRRELAGAPAQ